MTIDVDGLAVNYSDEGSGAAVLILEGWGTNISLYSELSRHLAKTHRVIIPDLPGFGLTPPPDKAWNVSDYTWFVKRFLDAIGIQEAVLIGHSHGGRVIIKLVTEDNISLKVPKIVLIGSAGIVHKKTLKQKLGLCLYKGGRGILSLPPIRRLFPDALESLRRRRGSEDYRNAVPVMRETMVKVINEDLRAVMPRVKPPALLIWGDKDTATPIGDARIMEKLMPDAGLVVVSGAGHYSYLEQPGFVYRVLDSFLGTD